MKLDRPLAGTKLPAASNRPIDKYSRPWSNRNSPSEESVPLGSSSYSSLSRGTAATRPRVATMLNMMSSLFLLGTRAELLHFLECGDVGVEVFVLMRSPTECLG